MNYSIATNTCNISSTRAFEEGNIVGGAEVERVFGTYVSTGNQLNFPDRLVVNGVPATRKEAGILALVLPSAGPYLAVLLVNVDNIRYRMEFNGEILNDAVNFGTSRLLSASVSASPVPVPAALPLLASGLGALGFIGWRRKRKAAAAA